MNRVVKSESLSAYENHTTRDKQRHNLRGKQDGRKNYPPSNQTEYSTYENELIADARTCLNNYIRQVKVVLSEHYERSRQLKSKAGLEYDSLKSSLLEQRGQELRSLNETRGNRSNSYFLYKKRLDEANSQYKQEKHIQGRDAKMHMHEPIFNIPWLSWLNIYIVLLGILAILEVQINRLAIEYSFEFGLFISFIVATLIGILLVLFAHFAGMKFKHVLGVKGWTKLLPIFWGVASLFVAGLIVYFLNELRMEFVADEISANTGGLGGATEQGDGPNLGALARDAIPAVGQTIQDVGNRPETATIFDTAMRFLNNLFFPASAETASAQTGAAPQTNTLTQQGLLILNSLVLLVGTIFSFIRHDSIRSLEIAHGRMTKSNLQVSYFLKKAEKAENEIYDEYATRIDSAQIEADQSEAELNEVKRKISEIIDQSGNDVRMVINVLIQQVSAYQDGNMETRTTEKPAYFGLDGIKKIGDDIDIDNAPL